MSPGILEKTAGRLLRSAGAASLSQIWRIGVTFVTHMILRRLIPPEEFGLWSWIEPLFLIIAQVRDIGIPGHLVRDRVKPYANYLGLQVGWGGPLTFLVLLTAPFLALFYADHDQTTVQAIRAMCLFLFVQGLGSIPLTFFEAELEVHKTIPAEIVRNLVFAFLSLWLAIHDYGVWSLIIAHIVGGVVFSAMLWWKAWGELRLTWRANDTWRLVKTSYPLAIMAVLEQMVMRLDAFVLALNFPTEVIAVAGLALFMVFFFSRLLADPVGRALYPALVRYAADPPRAFEAFRIATLFMLTLAVPTAFFLLVNADHVALFLGGDQWLEAADYLRVLSLVPLARPLNIFGLELLLTRHRDRLLIVFSLLNLVSIGGLGLYLTSTELGGIGMAVAGYFPVGSLVLAWGVYQLSPRGFRRLWINILELYAVAAVLFLPILTVTSPQSWPRVGLSCLAGLLVVGYMVRRFGRAFGEFLSAEEPLSED